MRTLGRIRKLVGCLDAAVAPELLHEEQWGRAVGTYLKLDWWHLPVTSEMSISISKNGDDYGDYRGAPSKHP